MNWNFGADRVRNEVILVGRILLVVLFIVFGWGKMTAFGATVAYMTQAGLPSPAITAMIAVLVEFFFCLVLLAGAFTRPLALLLAAYTVAAAFIGHEYWTMTGMARAAATINFYKNISIVGGFLLLYVTGPGLYSIDAALGRERPV